MVTGVQNDKSLQKKTCPTAALSLKYGHNSRSPEGEESKRRNPNQVIQMICVELGVWSTYYVQGLAHQFA